MAASPRRRWLYNILNPVDDVDDALNQVLLPGVRALHGEADRTFLLFHSGWTGGRVELPAAWEESSPRTERERLSAEIKRRDNRYEAGEEWYAEELRTKTAYYTDVLGRRIERFFASLRAEGLLDDTLVILTADHGHMYERGRFWYGFHPDEEVARVPMIVFGPGISGVDDVPRESIDITRTILEYFGGDERAQPRAVSILEPADKPYTVTATQPSALHHEWFVVLYRNGRKYVCNVAPGSDGACVEMDAGGREILAAGPGVLDTIRAPLHDALLELAIPPGDLHPLYQAVLAGAGASSRDGAAEPR